MRLKISGIGKIGDSEIEMNGITVIAGENNTGKSTFGKVLYCMFNAFCDSEMKIRNERTNTFARIFYNAESSQSTVTPRDIENITAKFTEKMENTPVEELSKENIKEVIMDAVAESVSLLGVDLSDIMNNAERSLTSVSAADIQKVVITRYFVTEFEGKVNHVNKRDSTGNVSLTIKEKNIVVNMQNNKCSDYDDNVGIRNKAIYIGTPLEMDEVQLQHNIEPFLPDYVQHYILNANHRFDLRQKLIKKYSNNTTIEEKNINQKFTGVLSNLNSITNGEFREDRVYGLVFLENGLNEPIPFFNVSVGIKTFLIIKRLLELGEIRERDVLIFDEPENHLHPAWQLQFAEILVLLQKEFNLTILLATHSPYFLESIEAYSEKHGIRKERVKFYLAENNGDTSDVRDVTDNVDAIYKQLAAPFRQLDTMEYGD